MNRTDRCPIDLMAMTSGDQLHEAGGVIPERRCDRVSAEHV